ncbi:MAG: 2,3-bisphosphoglycerate-independent phosphoglycerate mutase [Clostridia bacterium]|nr:2,3-bisphosphoglycerate-independent phosphoglycerate mutase [Clostridia bacterium]
MVTLVILDGFGLREEVNGNAIKLQGTPSLDKLNIYPHSTLLASGYAVGLTDGQMGNSEVGHLNLGAGRVVYQDLPRIDNAIADRSFFENKAINKTIDHCLENNSALHMMGLLSDGGVHSHIEHLIALIQYANEKGVKEVYIHAIMDGRDTPKDSGIEFIRYIERHKRNAQIATVCGRVYTMDRELRWDRVQKAYDMMAFGKAEKHASTAEEAMIESYKDGVYDEFVLPTIIGAPHPVCENDGIIFFNYRTDRAREITQAFTQKPFDKFETKPLGNLKFCCMTEYSADFKNVEIAFPPEKIEDNLSAIISQNGLKQFHTSETTKYAHVTFFFNGGIEKAYPGEDRKLTDSWNVQDYSQTPNMKAYEITEDVINAIKSKKYDFVLVNLSNADMLGHTGNIPATMQTIKVVDECAYKIAMETLTAGGDCIITADHGNAELMLDENGKPVTSHTTNPVPIWLVSEKYKGAVLNNGKLANVAPTILKLLGVEIPKAMNEPLF